MLLSARGELKARGSETGMCGLLCLFLVDSVSMSACVGVCGHSGRCVVNRACVGVYVCLCVRVLGQDRLAKCRGVQMESNRVRRTVPLQAVAC